MRSLHRRAPLHVFWLTFLLGACAASPDHGRFERHFEAPVIGGALQQQWQRPDRAIPELGLLATVPIAFALDSDLHEDTSKDPLSSGAKTAGDLIPIALGVGAMTVGGVRWADGDGARTFEAAGEALALTFGTTEILKTVVARERPDSTSSTSFPSGHTSFAFAATTVLLREFENPDDTSWNPLELVAYAPATLVAWERVRADKHWASDVAVGAFLGVFISNWVWDAHFSNDAARPTVFAQPSKVAWRFQTGDVDGRFALGLGISF